MSNKTQLQTNNTNLQSLIDRVNAAKNTAASLPEAGDGGGAIPIITLPVGATEIVLKPNTYYILTQPVATNLSLSFLSGQDGELSEYMLEIRADDDDIQLTFSEDVYWNEGRNIYDIQKRSVMLDGKYTHFFSVINSKGLTGSIVNPKLADTVVTYNTSTAKLCWTPVENAEWYEVYVRDEETSLFPIYSEIFTEVPSEGVTIPGFTYGNNIASGYVKACSKYYTDSKVEFYW